MFTATQKADIVRRHLKDRIPVSQLAEELNLQPTQIHTWVQTALTQLERALEKTGGKGKSFASKTEQQIKYWNERAEIPVKQLFASLPIFSKSEKPTDRTTKNFVGSLPFFYR
jgi:transposase-like protein